MLQIRSISYKALGTWYSGLVKPKKNGPPFNHVVQIGDPTLRTSSEDIPKDLIKSPEVEYIIKRLKSVFKKYKCVGLSAPQIGLPFNIFIMEFNSTHAKSYTEDEFRNMDMSVLSQKVVINPKIQIIDYVKIVHSEACESVKGFYADVPRYKAVKLSGFDENAEYFSMESHGWIARIIQHEIDHLHGKLYTDIMDRKSLTCTCWNVINEREGKVELPYGAY